MLPSTYKDAFIQFSVASTGRVERTSGAWYSTLQRFAGLPALLVVHCQVQRLRYVDAVLRGPDWVVSIMGLYPVGAATEAVQGR